MIFLLVADAIAQSSGAVLFGYGLASERKVLVPDASAIRVAPMRVGQDGSGLGVAGTF